MNIDTFIFVGGRSSRLGHDKALVEIGGMTLVERTAATLRVGLSPTSLSLVAANAEQFPDGISSIDMLPIVYDLHPNKGAFGALHSALTHAESEWAAVIACDLPLLSADLLQRLTGFISDEFDAVVPVQPDGRLQPLCAFYRVDPCLAFVNRVFDRKLNIPAIAAIFDQVRTRVVAFNEISDFPASEHFFLNINTPNDLEKARSLCVPAV